MKLSEFAGLDAKMEHLMRSAQAGRIVHALLFSGPRGTGKRSMARLFAQALLCSGEGERPCGCCPACKKCAEDMHPDVHFVAPEKSSIKVEQIRELIERMSLASYEGGKKIAIIERADSMGESAQNALLKTLESPTGDAIFFLLTDTPGALLPTILSRCLQLRFACLSVEACTQVLLRRGMEEDRARLLAALSQGSVGRALEMDADEAYLPLRRRVIDALEGMKKPSDVIHVSSICNSKDRQAQVLEIMELWARELMLVQNGGQSSVAEDMPRLKRSKYCGNKLLQQVMLARRQLAANLSWTNVLDNMEFELVCRKG